VNPLEEPLMQTRRQQKLGKTAPDDAARAHRRLHTRLRGRRVGSVAL